MFEVDILVLHEGCWHSGWFNMYCKTYLQFSSQIKRQMAEKLNFKKSMWLMCGSIGNGGGGWSKFKSFKIYSINQRFASPGKLSLWKFFLNCPWGFMNFWRFFNLRQFSVVLSCTSDLPVSMNRFSFT